MTPEEENNLLGKLNEELRECKDDNTQLSISKDLSQLLNQAFSSFVDGAKRCKAKWLKNCRKFSSLQMKDFLNLWEIKEFTSLKEEKSIFLSSVLAQTTEMILDFSNVLKWMNLMKLVIISMGTQLLFQKKSVI